MARVLVLTDRLPSDPDWKGAIAWDSILSLAESQHQVLVLTTLDPETIHVTHPRLTIARPAKSWDARQVPKFLQGILLFRPEIIHTFALKTSRLKTSRLWQGLTVWPYLHTACRVLPGVRRYGMVFENSDLPENDPSLIWHQGSRRTVVFSEKVKTHLEKMNRACALSPLEIEPRPDTAREEVAYPYVLVPAPVSEWKNPQRDLLHLAKHLRENPDLHARVAGGWGDWPAGSRRAAWSKMMNVADRLHMLEPLSLSQMHHEAVQAQSLWRGPIEEDSWRGLVVQALGQRPALPAGSTANFLSRLFAGSVESAL